MERARAAGYTLLEMLLVLAVLAILVAVAWPSVLKMQADLELSAAAEQVRMQLGQARSKAMFSGYACQFRFEPNGRHYCVVPFEADPESVPTGNSQVQPNPLKQSVRFAAEVSKNISFRAASANVSVLPQAQKLPESAFQGLPDVGKLAGVSWSAPTVFQVNGSASDAVVSVGDKRGYRIDITIRALTGAATVSAMHREAAK